MVALRSLPIALAVLVTASLAHAQDVPAPPAPASPADLPQLPPPPPFTAAPSRPLDPAATAAVVPTAPGPGVQGQTPGEQPKTVGVPIGEIGERETTWDINVEGAFGRALGENKDQTTGFGRIRGGILWIKAPRLLTLGATYEYNNFTPATFGIQGEAMHLTTGLWVQVGGMIDIQPRPGAMLAVGWSFFSAEVQERSYQDLGLTTAVVAKVRVPIGIIAFAIRQHR